MIRRHIRFSSVRQRGNIKSWRDKLKGVPCFVIGNAPSLNDEDLSLLSSYFTIGINRAFYKIDPTVLFWQDIELWYAERKKIVRLSAVKVCRTTADPQNRFFHYKLVPGEFQMPKHPQILYGHGATGPIAMQFAYAIGCDPIVMIGMDCKTRGNATDFYGKNRHWKPHTLTNCNKGLKWIHKTIKDRTIISCGSAKHWDRTTLKDAIKTIDSKWKKDRGYYVGLLNR